jgi:glycosyltransferase involved in cell wall biosynthesis
MPDQQTVVIIGPAHPLRGGLASYNERLAREFQAEGFRVILYTFSLQYPGFLFPGTTQYSSEPAPKDLEIRIAINSVNPLNWFITGKDIRKLAPGIIVVRYWLPFMGPCLGTLLRIARKNRTSRIICLADNIIPHEKRPGDRAFTRYFLKPVDAVITMSQKVLKDLRLFEPDTPAFFVPHPLYDNFGDPVPKAEARAFLGLPASANIILFFGFIRRYKGLDLLLQAMASEEIRQAGIRLVVAGEFYEDAESYTRQIAELGIADTVILRTAFIPDSQVKYYLCSADLVVQPYRHATQSGVTPLAYHFEKPMLVTNVGALPDMVTDEKAGLVAEPDAASLAAKMLRFFELGENHFLPHLREEKKKYAWSRMVKAIVEAAHGTQK